MALGSTMAAVNIPESRDYSLTLPPPERSTSGKGPQWKTRQGTAKNHTSALAPAPALASPLTNKRIADQAFHDVPSKIIPDSQLQNEVANLEHPVLEAKQAALQKQL